MKVRTGFLGLVLSAALAAGGCSVYDNSLLEGAAASASTTTGGTGGSGGNSTTEGGTTGGTAGSGGLSSDLCQGAPRKTYPPKPTSNEVPDAAADDITFVNAMYTIDLGDRTPMASSPTEYRNIGLDLDGECTTESDPGLGECELPDWATGSIDGPGGIDNAMGTLIQEVRERLVDWGSERYTSQLQAGGVNILYKISGYNGAPNDDHVRLDTYVAVALNALNPDASAPKWDGTDVWDVASDSVFTGLSDPKYFDDRAYVKDGQLVASYASNLRLEIALSSIAVVRLNLQLTPSAIVCDLIERSSDAGAPDTDRWEMSCILAGRWETDHLLHQLSQFPDPLNIGAPLCVNSTSYSAFKPLVCRPTDTFTGMLFPGAVCNALSFGVRFTTKPARVGDIYALSEPTERCPEGNQPSDDSCDTLSPVGSGGAGGTAGSGGTAGTGGRGSGGSSGSAGAGGTAGSASDASADAP